MEEIVHLIDENKLDDALKLLDENQEKESGKALAMIFLLRGRIYYKQHKWGEVINQFNEVLEIEPDNAEAKSGVEMAQNILGFFNPDLFNP